MNCVVSSDSGGAYMPEETWSAPSVPLTNGFRYNTSEPRDTYNQNSNSNPIPFTEYGTHTSHTQLSYFTVCLNGYINRCKDKPQVLLQRHGWTDGWLDIDEYK